MAVKQTAGRDALGEFAPKFAELNDEVLFGQVWSREDKLSLRDRSLVTVVALMAQGLTDSSFRYHLTAAKNNGITRTEIAEILTHAAFFMQAGLRRGLLSAWQRKSGQRTLRRMPRQSTRVKWCSPSARPTTVLHHISAEKAIWHPCPPHRLAFTTSPLSRAAGTTGTSTMLQRAVGRSLSAWQAGATIRNGAKRRRNCIRAMW